MLSRLLPLTCQRGSSRGTRQSRIIQGAKGDRSVCPLHQAMLAGQMLRAARALEATGRDGAAAA